MIHRISVVDQKTLFKPCDDVARGIPCALKYHLVQTKNGRIGEREISSTSCMTCR